MPARAPCGQGQISRDKAPRSRVASEYKHYPYVHGTVQRIDSADPSRGIKPRISLVDDSRTEHVFMLRPSTTIYNSDWKAASLEGIHIGQVIEVKYRCNKNGFKEALSIIMK